MANRMDTRAQQALARLDVRRGSKVVVVRDGWDTWLCTRTAWDTAIDMLGMESARGEGEEAEAYSELCALAR